MREVFPRDVPGAFALIAWVTLRVLRRAGSSTAHA